jgi:transposase-like protein
MTMTFADHLFKRRHFDRLIITLCVRWYVSYRLSYRGLVEMMAERRLPMAHTTIMRLAAEVRSGVRMDGGADAIR